MLAKVISFGINGLDAYNVTIETDISLGLPLFTIVGLADTAVKESRERVRTAIRHSGFDFPYDRITVNLAPANTKKEGPAFDAAIALCILSACGCIPSSKLLTLGIAGELSLDGEIKPIHGILSMAMACKESGLKGFIVPYENAAQASLIDGLNIYPAKTLAEICGWFMSDSLPSPFVCSHILIKPTLHHLDFSDVKGQLAVKRGLEVAAAGGHNALVCGPPGSGKTMLAKRLSTILPPMTTTEALEVTRIHSIIGKSTSLDGLMKDRPVRSPHHTASDIALIGGGSHPKPGEVTLAHHGVLFLDEFPEFSRHVLETLRQPLEDGFVTIARAKECIRFPASFMLIAAMNPCPCGFKNDPNHQCRCTPKMMERYSQKISGPLLDRIDIYLSAPALNAEELMDMPLGESSNDIRQRTCLARDIQHKRFITTPYTCNAHIDAHKLKNYCFLNDSCRRLLKSSIKQLRLSTRAHDRILRVARTISDLDNHDEIQESHLAEAIGYREQTQN